MKEVDLHDICINKCTPKADFNNILIIKTLSRHRNSRKYSPTLYRAQCRTALGSVSDCTRFKAGLYLVDNQIVNNSRAPKIKDNCERFAPLAISIN